MNDQIQVGDLVRFSVELIRQIKDAPGEKSDLVRVDKIETLEDGSKIVWVARP